jgi:PhnB protein
MKTQLSAYLFFKDNCREALEFYKKAIGGELKIMTYGDVQKNDCPPGLKDKIMHAMFTKDDTILMMASDTDGKTPTLGTNVQLCLNCSTLHEIDTVFAALSENAKVGHPLHDTFWGARFGDLVDKYGVHWMLNFEKPK